jgi:hypothetical protein
MANKALRSVVAALVVGSLFVALSMVSACGSGSIPGGPSPPTPPAPPTAPPVPPGPAPPSGIAWNDLPPLSEAGKAFVTSYNLDLLFEGSPRGQVRRWDTFPIPVYADPDFGSQALDQAFDFWARETGGKVTFRKVNDPAEAAIIFGFDESKVSAGFCGAEGGAPNTTVAGAVFTRSAGWYSRRKECAPNGDWKIGLTHGLGHILGLYGHTFSDSDVMGSPQSRWGSTALLTEVINWVYSVPPGTRPQ